MHKKIILSLLLITITATHGMETQEPTVSLEMALCNPDNAWRITKHLCMNYSPYSHNSQNLRNDIRALYETNKFFHNYYGQEKMMQNIITTCEPRYCSLYNSYRNVINILCCNTIAKKINRFCDIANNKEMQFTEDDLKDPWYFKIPLGHNYESLLYLLIQTLQFEKAHTLISHAQKLDFGRSVNNYVLKLISESRHSITDENTREELLRITERLLHEKNMPADGTFLPLTALMDASQNNDQPFARLLLQFDANPYKRRGNSSWGNNSFEIEKGEPKGWLRNMVKIIKFFKYWPIKNYAPDGYTLPQELLHIIFRTIQQLHYHYDLDTNLLNKIIDKRHIIRKQECEKATDDFFKKNKVVHIDENGNAYVSGPTRFKPDINNILKDHTEYHNLFAKAQRLLQKGFRPNFRKKNSERLPLMYAVEYNDEAMIQLLTDFGSNPYLEIYNASTKTMMNAFDFTKNNQIKEMLAKNDF